MTLSCPYAVTMRWLLVLQVSVFLQLFLCLPFTVVHVIGLLKRYDRLSETDLFLTTGSVVTLTLTDAPRLGLAFVANRLPVRRPELVLAFALMTTLISMPLVCILLFAVSHILSPIEVTMDLIELVFLMMQSVTSLAAARKSVIGLMSQAGG